MSEEIKKVKVRGCNRKICPNCAGKIVLSVEEYERKLLEFADKSVRSVM